MEESGEAHWEVEWTLLQADALKSQRLVQIL